MNTTPMLHGKPVYTSCGRTAMANLARYFWQSRMTTAGDRAPLPELVDIPELAKVIRSTYPRVP